VAKRTPKHRSSAPGRRQVPVQELDANLSPEAQGKGTIARRRFLLAPLRNVLTMTSFYEKVRGRGPRDVAKSCAMAD